MKNYQLKNRYGSWALITRASSGIGKSFAKQFAFEGINLILVARREEKLKILAKELQKEYSIQIVIIQLNIISQDYLDILKKSVEGLEISIIVNNAGFGMLKKFHKIETEVLSEMIKLNCLAPDEITSFFLPKMIAKKKGAVIFVASIVGYQPVPFFSVYSATKVFDLFFGEALWYELKEQNIDVITVSPGGTITEFQQIAGTTQKKYYRTPEQVVDTTLKHLGKKPSVVDGWLNKIMTAANKLLPSKISVIIAGRLVKFNEKI